MYEPPRNEIRVGMLGVWVGGGILRANVGPPFEFLFLCTYMYVLLCTMYLSAYIAADEICIN